MKPITKLLCLFSMISFFSGCDHFARHLSPKEEPVATKMYLPKDSKKYPLKETDKAFMVDIMGEGKLLCYYKNPEQNIPANAAMDIAGLRKALKEGLEKYKKDFVVLIRPSDKAEYKELVNILDEMAINNATRYALEGWTPVNK